MLITGGESAAPGTALLIAAAPVGKGRLIDASSALPALAAVPPGALTGTEVATVVELADPLDPQTVLTRVRAAAAAPGPLLLCLAGQLQLDRKQRLVHLALARSTAATLRYTGLPWHWLAAELAVRRPGTTTVLLDLVADADAWTRVAEAGELGLGPSVPLYGRITPPPGRRGPATPEYLRACAEIWRSGARPDLATLHEHAAVRAGGEGVLLLSGFGAPAPSDTGSDAWAPAPAPSPAGTESASPPPPPGAAPTPRPEPDPHPGILAAARAGRHSEAAAAAAAWEQQELRTHGPGSPQALHWLEVRADLARLAREPGLSCELWMTAAEARLAQAQAPDDLEVEAAVDRAHHQWEQLTEMDRARALAPRLVALRRRVPGRQRGALRVLRQRLESLHATR
ncbi:hypothetical protein ACFVIM_17390 [Streptomyces sp. NPDC057638]|uniref:hypothetical protein n=1 Tax=Streptomyces sp. NPDC057638 TaxID=3346190 RepID=UPI00367FCB58